MKHRSGEPWRPADQYGRSLEGLTINLLVREVAAALPFHRQVLDAEEVYSDPDFAVLRYRGVEWMLHADHTYDAHPFRQRCEAGGRRGDGVELRLHGRDPDAAEALARELGYEVLAGARDRPHGLREAFIVDGEGYVWVTDIPSAA